MNPICGVTFETTPSEGSYGFHELVSFLKSFTPLRATVRLVWQPDESPSSYYKRIQVWERYADILACVCDSTLITRLSILQYRDRTQALADLVVPEKPVRVETLNEGGGDWLGLDKDVYEKARAAEEVCRKAKLKTAATFYLTGNNPLRMIDFARNSRLVPDWAMVSWYPNWTPSAFPDWVYIYYNLGEIFKLSDLCFGEFGPQPKKIGLLKRETLIRSIHSINPRHARFRRGGFYWDAGKDFMVHDVLRDTLVAV